MRFSSIKPIPKYSCLFDDIQFIFKVEDSVTVRKLQHIYYLPDVINDTIKQELKFTWKIEDHQVLVNIINLKESLSHFDLILLRNVGLFLFNFLDDQGNSVDIKLIVQTYLENNELQRAVEEYQQIS